MVRNTLKMKRLSDERAKNAKMIAIMNNKGGCGKTTLSSAIGLHAARLGYNVMFWDCDPQSNLTQRLGMPDVTFKDRRVNQFFRNIDMDSFTTDHMKLPLVIQYPYFYRISGTTDQIGTVGIMAGSHIAEIEATAALKKLDTNEYSSDRRDLFKAFHEGVHQYLDYFDYIVMDTAPAMEGNVLSRLAVRTAKEIVCPIDGIEAANGLRQLLNWIDVETSPDKGVKVKPNMLFAMMKYQDDTVNISVDEEDRDELVKNIVYRALKDNLGEYVCDYGIKEKRKLRNIVYGGFGRKNEYEDLCGEILTRLSRPRPNIFDNWSKVKDNLQEDIARIDMKALNKTPLFKSPRFIGKDGKDVVTSI